jgi:DAK2 domain fusion protein YloV
VDDRPPLDAPHLREMLARVHAALAAHRTHIDELNVFPVPDGDTGTNMLMTVRATLDAVAEAAEAEDPPPPSGLCRVVTRAAMLGARGNSGVILSQVLRALAETLSEDGPLDAGGLSRFLGRARALAYEAVAEPVEGTILTAIAAADDAAREHPATVAVPEALDAVRAAVRAAVRHTREQLDVLRDAGVVDAGARGFEVVVDALHGHVTGVPVDELAEAEPSVRRAGGELTLPAVGSLTHRFEVQYLLDAPDEAAPGLRRRLEDLGDSVVVVASDGLSSVHVHTNDVGAAIEEGVRLGRPSRIEVTYFAEQAAARRDCAVEDDAPRRLGCVAVLPGPGLRAVAEQHGAVVVEGAAGELPSVADLLNAVGAVRAERIVVLPGHPNAVPTATQASSVSSAEGGRELVVVAAARTVPAALSALAVCDPAGEPDAVVADMEAAAAAVRAGEVIAAVRDATTPVGDIREGQHLAVVDDEVVAVSDEPLEALRRIAERCCDGGCELVTIVIGADVDDEEADAAVRVVEAAAGDAEVEVIAGGQRPARYLLGAE